MPDSRLPRTKRLLWIGFGGLLLLLGVLGTSSISFLYQIEARHEKLRQDYVRRDQLLEKLRASIYVSGTYFRDFILDVDEEAAMQHREQFVAVEAEIQSRLGDYERVIGPPEQKPLQELRAELRGYFGTLDPALRWTLPQRAARASRFIQDQLQPRRTAVIGMADQIQQVSDKQLEMNGEAVSEMFSSFRTRLLLLFILAIVIGLVLAAATMWRLLQFERLSATRFSEVVEAREELKQLSAKLVSAEEEERRRISRELHDEVGQVLSAMMLGLGNIRSSITKGGNIEGALGQIRAIEDMTEGSARAVRNLSLTLRPTMLDDLGLVAALKWLAREVSRGGSLQVEVIAEDTPDELAEEHRTCVYRVVQEALRNASRHSGALHARISIETEGGRLRVTVQDEGKGFDPHLDKGLGILGMEERVKRLGGSFHVESASDRGSKVAFELPLPAARGKIQETNPLRTA